MTKMVAISVIFFVLGLVVLFEAKTSQGLASDLTITRRLPTFSSASVAQAPTGTAFTYQGRLNQQGQPANGSFDFQFELEDEAGSSMASAIELHNVPVTEGLFTVQLDFGADAFTGDALWLDIGVKPSAQDGPFISLSPRQPLTPTPYAMFATKSGSDGDWNGAGSGSMYQTNLSDNVGIGTSAPNEQLEITGNFRLPKTTATTGIIMSDGNPLIHSFGVDNFFAGRNAGNLTMTGFSGIDFNTGVGVNALASNTEGFSNTALGESALRSNTKGISNTALGQTALLSNTTGGSNTAVGQNALRSNDKGSGNTAVGHLALFFNVEGDFNTAVGGAALRLNKGDFNTAVGSNALANNTDGFDNTAVGRNALRSNDTGIHNTAVGVDALGANVTGFVNTAVGRSALALTTGGTHNTAVGDRALSANTLGSLNTAVGHEALRSNTEGTLNTAVGVEALSANITGFDNTAVGRDALLNNTEGFDNTALGKRTLLSNTTGDFNTALGRGADVSTGDLSNATAIGSSATVDASNKIRLGDSNVTLVETQGDIKTISGDFIAGATTLNVPDYVFEKDYALMSLEQLRAYISENKHLPNVPDESDIRKNGLNLSEFQMTLLEKIEELTLYTLVQQREIAQLKAQVGGGVGVANGVDSSGNSVVVLAGGVAGMFVVITIIMGWYVLVGSGRRQIARRDML